MLINAIALLLPAVCALPSQNPTIYDLHADYARVFKYGNRNAASHLWVAHILKAAPTLPKMKVTELFTGFCAVSGSPVRPSDYNRYRLTLPAAGGGNVSAYMHYCCWPCVCDVQDFVMADTKAVQTQEGPVQMHFAVIGDPCVRPDELHRPFVQPFYGQETTLARDAPEVRCVDGRLAGAVISDHGHVMIGSLFDAQPLQEHVGSDFMLEARHAESAQPGRISRIDGVAFQDETEYAPLCAKRERNGHDSGMGEIFRRVAAISPLVSSPGRLSLPSATQQHSIDAAANQTPLK